MSDLTVETTRSGELVTFRVTGDLDYGNDDVVLAAARKAVQDASVTAVSFDLSALGFCDSTGLGALIAIRNLAVDRGVALTLQGPRTALLRLLEMTGLATVFTIAPAPPEPESHSGGSLPVS